MRSVSRHSNTINQKFASHPYSAPKKPPDAGPKIGDIAIPKEIYAILALDFRVLVVSRTTALAITIKHVDAACTALKSINLSI